MVTSSHEMDSYDLKISSFPFSEQITTHRFLRKFVMSSFDLYSGAIDPIQHLQHYQDKMVVYSHDELLMSRVFPSSLKRVTSDWFYSLPSHSLRDFEKLKQVFYNQFASSREFKKNINHLLTVKIKPEENLKHYVSRWLTFIIAMKTLWQQH